MDGQRFDEISRSLASGTTRRGLLAGLAAGILGAIGLRGKNAQASQANCGNTSCRNNPGKCAPGCVCCVYGNGNSRCRPPGNCSGGSETCPPDRPFIDQARGCVQCLDASQCAAPAGACEAATCTNGVCGVGPVQAGTGCRAAADVCDVPEVCDGSSPACPADGFAPTSAVCRSASCADGVATLAENCPGTGAACPTPRTQSCAPYRCAGTACATGCADDTGCVDGYHCDNGQCLLDAGLGTPCDENSDCESEYCVDGVCCNSACAGLCDSCAGATPGICTTAACDAPGTCQVGPGTCNAQTGACGYGPAPNGTGCGTGGQVCCGGACCDAGESCVEGSCQVACSDLGGACAGNDDCCGTGICDNGRCLPCHALGEICLGEEVCCNDGVTLCEGGQCCHPLSESCAFNTDCCSFRCQDGACCSRPGRDCTDDGDCCFGGIGVCRQGVCACQDVGTGCAESDDCCDDLVCQGGTCRPGTCQDLQGPCVSDTDCCADSAFCPFNACCNGIGGPCDERGDCCGGDTACIRGSCQACLGEDAMCLPIVGQTGCCDEFECRIDARTSPTLPFGERFRCLPAFCSVPQERCGAEGEPFPAECCDGVCEGVDSVGAPTCCQLLGGACRNTLGEIPGLGDCCAPNVCNGARQCAPCRAPGQTCDGNGRFSNCCGTGLGGPICFGGVCCSETGLCQTDDECCGAAVCRDAFCQAP